MGNILKKLRTITLNTDPNFSSSSSTNHPKSDDCAICLLPMIPSTAPAPDFYYTLDCSHSFHRACIARWLMWSKDCPLCRKIVGNTAMDELHNNQQQASWEEHARWLAEEADRIMQEQEANRIREENASTKGQVNWMMFWWAKIILVMAVDARPVYERTNKRHTESSN